MILAVEHFTEAIRLNPIDFTYFSNRSASLLQLGKLADAEADARECIKIKPQLAKGHFRLSQALLASGKDGEAVEALRSACKLEPLNAQLRGQLTRAERKLQQQQQAKHVPPSSQEATASAEPQQQQQQQQPSKEGKSASSAKDAWSSGDAELAAKAYERASKWADNGENMRAAEGFTEAINLAPSNPSYYAARSHVLLKASRFDDALEDACKSLTLRPGNPLGTVRKGQALAMLGRMDLAIETLEAGVEAHPDDAQLKNALGKKFRE
jgi:predicted Zn-dependent protease